MPQEVESLDQTSTLTWSKEVHAAAQVGEGVVAVLGHEICAVKFGAQVAGCY